MFDFIIEHLVMLIILAIAVTMSIVFFGTLWHFFMVIIESSLIII